MSYAVALGALALGVLVSSVLRLPPPEPDRPIRFPPAPPIDTAEIIQVLPQDEIPAIMEPGFMSARSIEEQMSLEERVLGVVINGDARAYPINVLSAHEIVNDVVGGEPVAVTWCPLCYTGLVFSRRIEGLEDELTFGVSGKLLRDTLIMYDTDSGSMWSQLYGAAIEGEHAGRSLNYFPSTHTEWRVWREQYPDTQVLSKDSNCKGIDCRTYASDPYASYYAAEVEGLVNRQLPRQYQLGGPKTRVFGIVVGDHARAYPLEALSRTSLVNDDLGGVPVLIWFDSASETGAAYRRQVGEQTLTFEAANVDATELRDLETGSRWRALSGIAIGGPLRNTELESLIATTAFEFGWEAYYPHGDTFKP